MARNIAEARRIIMEDMHRHRRCVKDASNVACRVFNRKRWYISVAQSRPWTKTAQREYKAIPPSNMYFDFVVRFPCCLCISYLLFFIALMGGSVAAYGVPVLETAFTGFEVRGDGLAFGTLLDRILQREVEAGALVLNETNFSPVVDPRLRIGIMEPSNMVLWFQSNENLLTPDFVHRSCEAGRTLRRKCVDHPECHVCRNCHNGTLFTLASAIQKFFPQEATSESCTVPQGTIDKFVRMMNRCYNNAQRKSEQCKSKKSWDLIFSYAVPLSWKPQMELHETALVLALETLEGGDTVPDVHANDLYSDVLLPVIDSQEFVVGASVYSIFGKADIFLASAIFELWHAGVAAFIIFSFVLWHTKSLFVTAGGFLTILVSLGGTGFVYHVTMPFWPFLNLVVVFILIGIGVDDIFVYMDTWNQSHVALPPETPLSNRVAWTTKSAASSMLVTTLTDAVSFFANIVSPVTVLRVFGIFSGLAILFNYLLLILVLPCLVAIIGRQAPFRGEVSAERPIDHFFADMLGAFVYRARIPLAAFFFVLGLVLIQVALMFGGTSPGRNTVYIDRHPLEKWDLGGYTHFGFSETQDRLNIALIFGVRNADNGHKFTPISREPKFEAAYPTLEYISLDITSGGSKYLKTLCDKAKTQDWFPPNDPGCIDRYYTTPDATEKLVMVLIPTSISVDGSFATQKDSIAEIDRWAQPLLEDAPPGLRGGWWNPVGFEFYALSKGLREGLPLSMGVSISAAFLVLLITSRSMVASVLATLAVVFSVVGLIAGMVVAGWSLNVIESLILSIAVGLTVDFSCHLSHAFMHSHRQAKGDMNERETRLRSAAGSLGVSVSMAAITSFFAGVAMVPAMTRLYYQFGVYLIITMSVSWIFAFFFFLPAMGIFGPVSTK